MTDTGAVASRPTVVTIALLAFAAGAGDAFAFTQLGGVFTANMTGSLVLAGLTSRPAYGSLLLGASTALVAFVLAVYLAGRCTSSRARASRAWLGARLRVALYAVAALDLIVLLVSLAAPASPPTASWRLTGLALSAAAMGCQTAAAKRFAGESGVTTTFVTGTLTSLVIDAADGKTAHAAIRVAVIVLVVIGALVTAGAMTADARLGPLVAAATAFAAALAFPRAHAHPSCPP